MVIVLCGAVHKVPQFSLCIGLSGKHGAGIVVAGLTHHVSKPSLFYLFRDFMALFRMAGHGNRTVDMFAVLQRLYSHGTMQMPLRKQSDSIDFFILKNKPG